MKVRFEGDDTEFEAADAEGAVEALRASSWIAYESAESYMQDVANRVSEATEQTIRTDNALVFLFDLEHAGVVRVEFLTPDEATVFNELENERWVRDEREKPSTGSADGENGA